MASAKISVRDELAKARAKAKREKLERLFEVHLKAYGLTGYTKQHRFHSIRRWQLDFAFPDVQLAIEIEGLDVQKVAGKTVTGGRHVSIKGYREDTIKYNAAVEAGWRLLRYTSAELKSGAAIAQVERVLKSLRRAKDAEVEGQR